MLIKTNIGYIRPVFDKLVCWLIHIPVPFVKPGGRNSVRFRSRISSATSEADCLFASTRSHWSRWRAWTSGKVRHRKKRLSVLVSQTSRARQKQTRSPALGKTSCSPRGRRSSALWSRVSGLSRPRKLGCWSVQRWVRAVRSPRAVCARLSARRSCPKHRKRTQQVVIYRSVNQVTYGKQSSLIPVFVGVDWVCLFRLRWQ